MESYSLSSLCDITSSTRIFKNEYSINGIPFYRSKEIIQKALGENVSDCVFINTNRFLEIKLKYDSPSAGDILLSSVGNRSGIPYLVKDSDGDFYFKDGNLIWIRNFDKKLNNKFLYYWLTTEKTQKQLNKIMIGSAQKALTIVNVSNLLVDLPPLSKQNQIADILSSFDNKIDLNRQMNQTLEAMTRTIFKSWFVDFDPVYAKMEGRDYPLPPEIMDLFPEELEESELGLIPKKWRVGELGEYVKVNNSNIGKDFQYDEINYIDISSVQEGKIISSQIVDIKSAPSRAKRVVNHGDIIWSCVRPNRRSFALLQMPSKNTIVSTGFAVITPNYLPYTYVYSIVSRKEFSDYLTINATGSAYPAVNPQIFINYKFVFPNEKILFTFHDYMVNVFNKIKNNFDQIETLSSLRELLLPKIISGKIEV